MRKTSEEIAEAASPEKDGQFTAQLKASLKADIEDYATRVAQDALIRASLRATATADYKNGKYTRDALVNVASITRTEIILP